MVRALLSVSEEESAFRICLTCICIIEDSSYVHTKVTVTSAVALPPPAPPGSVLVSFTATWPQEGGQPAYEAYATLQV